MIELIRGKSIVANISKAIRLELSLGLGYSRGEIAKLKPDEAISILDKNNMIKWIEKDSNINDPFTKQKRSNQIVNRVQNPKGNATIRHKEVESLNKNPSHLKANQPDPIKETHQPVSKRVRNNRKVHTLKDKAVVKIKSVMSPRKMRPMSILNKLKGANAWTKVGIAVGTTIAMSYFANSFSKPLRRITPTRVSNIGLDVRGSAYIPEKYSRGYDTIKEATTDFGSKVKLNKTASKVNVTPRNSTRDSFNTAVNPLIRSNMAFQLHDKAIGHTRY